MATETEAGRGLEIHPMDQFLVRPVLGDGSLMWYSFSNTAMWMAITLLGIIIFLVVGTRKKSHVPDRFQMVVELIYGFVRNMVQDVAGRDALPYFPYIMTAFMFVIFSNVLGLIPMSFTPTSHIAVTATLALTVFIAVTVIGFVKHGLGFLGLFWISSAPLPLRPVLAVIEIMSYFVRPLSHSIRLAGNMMAGHAMIKVFAAFAGVMGFGAFVPIIAISAVYALELLVALIQAYVFTILTCVYLKDALHPQH
ncbi:MAG: F0F1 ATP synthase subunit A [Rhodobacteraceae bacterium]|nr:F0F1 ATP synthase subunit A [Paracoccaceae bacterium]MCY4248991.1 F0F1 ATP synthase subunit A [Paracoccaceae bacterium]MCY4308601.1 F0F1 ATP synthase subunit A [Paracoccaceae bacterium]